MRLIGQLDTEDTARIFGDYLYVKGIDNEVEHDPGSGWGIWIHDEDKLDQASEILAAFRENPDASQYKSRAKVATDLRAERTKSDATYRKKVYDRRQIFRRLTGSRFGPLTLSLIGISVLVFLISRFGTHFEPVTGLFISEKVTGLPEIRAGQFWRLFTPIFIHLHLLHILFNMLWLADLGTAVERQQSSRYLLVMVLGIALVSNLGQYFVGGPAFGGMSGVVYGLLGYIWTRGKLDPASGYFLHPTTATLMLIWLVFGFLGFMRIANGAHTVGLMAGVAWGYFASRR